jgi:tripartite-type tricarboxylate transporter receptor subunit TctC
MKNTRKIILGISTLSIIILIITGILVFTTPQFTDEVGNPTSDDVAAFYEGEIIRFLIPSAPGGGFDEYSRMLAPYLEKYSGSRVQIIYLPGAGGTRANNELSNSPKNGLTIGFMNGSGMITDYLADIQGAQYTIDGFEYLGRVVADTRVLVVTTKSRIKNINDIFNSVEEVKLGATGLGDSGYIDGVITKEAFDMNVQIVHGFDASAYIRQAMLRGDLDGTWGAWGSALDAVNSGLETVVLQSGRERITDLPDVPTAFDLIDVAENRELANRILMAWDTLNSIGRPIATTPGTPPDRVDYLRNVLRVSMQDPEFLKTAARAKRSVNYASGEEVLEIISNAIDMDDDVKQLFTRAVKGELF